MGGTGMDPEFLEVLARVAPGTGVRTAVERIVQQGNGALVIIGSGPAVRSIAAGGFQLRDTAFTPAKLAELAKMDGAIILDGEITKILWANVHMLPDPVIPTEETGARFRTAERLARSLVCPVVAISEERRQGYVFYGDRKEPLRSPTEVMIRINQEVLTLERFRGRLAEANKRLVALEQSEEVVVGDALVVLQRVEVLRRIALRIEHLAVGLGEEGEMVELQLSDIMEGVEDLGGRVNRDYFQDQVGSAEELVEILRRQPLQDLSGTERLARAFGVSPDHRVSPTRHHHALTRFK